MEKIATKLNKTRLNWWEAFRLAVNVKGYEYYKPPPELKYRYPAPGSSPHDPLDHPHLYKKHWKTPYRESPLNIQKRERIITDGENVEISVSAFPDLDPSDYYDRLIMREKLPTNEGKKDMYEGDENKSIEEKRNELWNAFEEQPQIMYAISRDFAPWHNLLYDDYYPVQVQWRERGATGFEWEPRMKHIFQDLEYLIEDYIGAKRIKEKKMDMYKGTIKKWQVLDDTAHDREQVQKLQAATKAPSPDELDFYKEKHSKPMTLPINNANVSAWRDESRAIDTADFDPQFLEYDRERRKRFFNSRYEKVKELTSPHKQEQLVDTTSHGPGALY